MPCRLRPWTSNRPVWEGWVRAAGKMITLHTISEQGLFCDELAEAGGLSHNNRIAVFRGRSYTAWSVYSFSECYRAWCLVSPADLGWALGRGRYSTDTVSLTIPVLITFWQR